MVQEAECATELLGRSLATLDRQMINRLQRGGVERHDHKALQTMRLKIKFGQSVILSIQTLLQCQRSLVLLGSEHLQQMSLRVLEAQSEGIIARLLLPMV